MIDPRKVRGPATRAARRLGEPLAVALRWPLIQLGGDERRPLWSGRLLSAAAASLVVVGVLAFQLARLQVTDGPRLAALARANSVRHVVLEADRGIIYDRHGTQLVVNRPAWALQVVPAALLNAVLNIPGFRLSQWLEHRIYPIPRANW